MRSIDVPYIKRFIVMKEPLGDNRVHERLLKMFVDRNKYGRNSEKILDKRNYIQMKSIMGGK